MIAKEITSDENKLYGSNQGSETNKREVIEASKVLGFVSNVIACSYPHPPL